MKVGVAINFEEDFENIMKLTRIQLMINLCQLIQTHYENHHTITSWAEEGVEDRGCEMKIVYSSPTIYSSPFSRVHIFFKTYISGLHTAFWPRDALLVSETCVALMLTMSHSQPARCSCWCQFTLLGEQQGHQSVYRDMVRRLSRAIILYISTTWERPSRRDGPRRRSSAPVRRRYSPAYPVA